MTENHQRKVQSDHSTRLDRLSVIYRILDANLDRAREGLRVIEEWCRFGLEDAALSQECKDLRQQLASWHSEKMRESRDTNHDPGTNLSHGQELKRSDVQAVLRANLCRVQEALRVLEEYSKVDPDLLDLSTGAKSLRYRLYMLESKLFDSTGFSLKTKLQAAKLYLVTMSSDNLLETVEASLQAGLGLVQYREKEGNDRDRFNLALSLCQLCHRYNSLFLVNDRLDLALAVGADGIHLGQTDLPVAVARSLLGKKAIIGLSTTCPEELEIALNSDVDYVGVGPVYATPTKPGKAASGFEYVSYAAAKLDSLNLPWYAIGGIDLSNVSEVLNAGASRVAVVRSLVTATNPKQTTELFLKKLNLEN
jgi:thiamine-phosphate pyrophosphorylase